MAKNNKNGNGKKSKKSSIGGMLWKGIKETAGPLIFVSNVTEVDRETMGDSYNEAGFMQKGKILVNLIGGRMLGITTFGDEVTAPATFHIEGIFNKWTGLGVALKLYAAAARGIKLGGKTLLPHGGKMDQLSTRVFTAGIVSGPFRPLSHGSHNTLQTSVGTKHIQLIGSTTTNKLVSQPISNVIQVSQPSLEAPLVIPDSAGSSF